MFWWNVILPRFNFFIFQTHYLILWKPKPKEQWTLQNLLSCTHVSSCLRQKAWPFLHSFLTLLSCSFSCQDHIHFHQRIYPVFMAKKDLGNTKWSRWLMFYALVACKRKTFLRPQKVTASWYRFDYILRLYFWNYWNRNTPGTHDHPSTPPRYKNSVCYMQDFHFISFHLIGLLRMAKKLLRNGKMTF